LYLVLESLDSGNSVFSFTAEDKALNSFLQGQGARQAAPLPNKALQAFSHAQQFEAPHSRACSNNGDKFEGTSGSIQPHVGALDNSTFISLWLKHHRIYEAVCLSRWSSVDLYTANWVAHFFAQWKLPGNDTELKGNAQLFQYSATSTRLL